MNYKLEPFDIEKAKAGAKVVCRDGEPFEPLSFKGRGKWSVVGYRSNNETPTKWDANGSFADLVTHHADLMLSITAFPDPPAGEVWHNPENLTPEQVGEGYRLLLASEISTKRNAEYFIEYWHSTGRWSNDGACGACQRDTYRVPSSTAFHWDKPKEPTYRPFTFEEIQEHVGKVVKSKDGGVVELIIHASDAGLKVSTNYQTTQSLMDFYTFLDGSPCGVPV